MFLFSCSHSCFWPPAVPLKCALLRATTVLPIFFDCFKNLKLCIGFWVKHTIFIGSFAVFATFRSIYLSRTAVFFIAILSFCLCQLVRYPYVALSSAEVFRQFTCTRPWFDRLCRTLVPGFNCRSFRTFSDLSWKRLPTKEHRQKGAKKFSALRAAMFI